MGISLQNASVHKCTRVAFVGITTDIFLLIYRVSRKLPLQPGWKSAAASAAQSGIFYSIYNFLRLHLGKRFTQSFVSVSCYIFINIFRIDNTTVSQSYTVLFFIKINFIQRLYFVSALMYRLIIQKSLHYSTF